MILPPILARSSAVSFNSANPTWDRTIFHDDYVITGGSSEKGIQAETG